MDKCREEFEKAFPIPAHGIEFDEKENRYYCPYVADATASKYQSQWVVWQHQQAKVDELQKRVDAALEDMELESLKLKEGYDGYKDPVGICQSEGIEIARKILEQALKGEG